MEPTQHFHLRSDDGVVEVREDVIWGPDRVWYRGDLATGLRFYDWVVALHEPPPEQMDGVDL